MTLAILWEEYIAADADGYRYSRFCELYRAFADRLPVTMRQSHAGGDKLFVDYAGDTVPVIVDRLTGAKRPAQIFVAVLGASSFSYAEATWTQTLPDWIAAHTRALAAIGGAPKLLVPDNAKVAIVKACRYDPQVNRTYSEMAAHYGAAVLPARPRKPRDKAKVEVCVLIVERWLLGRLRHRQFYSLGELNQAIFEMLAEINERRPLRRLGVTRRQLFEELDRPALGSSSRRALRLRGMAAETGGPRLSRRCRWPLLQRSPPLCPRGAGGAAHRPHGGGLQEGRTHRRALALLFGGLLIIANHQYWSSASAILISLFGWFLALRGLALLIVPHLYEKAGIEAINAISLVRISFSLLVLAGLWLTYTGWIAKPPRNP